MRNVVVLSTTLVALFLTCESATAQPRRCRGTVAAATGTYQEIFAPGANETMGTAMNASGHVVGVYRVNSDGGHAFVYRNGEFETFDAPNAVTTVFLDINDSGAVLGYYYDDDGFHSFIRKRNEMTHLPTSIPSVGPVFPQAMSNTGTVVGLVFVEQLQQYHGFVITPKGVEVVKFPGADETWLTDVGPSNQIIGVARLPGSNQYFSFIYARGEFTVLQPCSFGLTPQMFVGSTPFVAGTPSHPNIPDGGYVGFVESPAGITLLRDPASDIGGLVDVNAAGYALLGGISYARTILYSPR
jgi:hypothetical protein